MSSVTEICLAVTALLGSLPDVDTTSIDEYYPLVQTEKIGLIVTPFRQKDLLEQKTAQPSVVYQSHFIHAEFWVKHDTGDIAATLRRAREIGTAAARRLLREDKQPQPLRDTVSRVGWYGLNGPGPRVEAQVHERPVGVNGVSYIVADVSFGVIDYADAET